jgi:hypothetical protein
MNTNPTLILGLAQQWAEVEANRSGRRLTPADLDQAELRVYNPSGSGFHFVRAMSPGRWYYKADADADGFTRADQAALDAAVAAGARVQFCGYHYRPLGTWPTWAAFEAALNPAS